MLSYTPEQEILETFVDRCRELAKDDPDGVMPSEHARLTAAGQLIAMALMGVSPEGRWSSAAVDAKCSAQHVLGTIEP